MAQQFERDGYLVIKGFFSSDQAQKLCGKARKLLREFDLVRLIAPAVCLLPNDAEASCLELTRR